MACRDRITVAVAIFSSALSVARYFGHVSSGNVVLVAIAGATLEMVAEQWKGR